MISLSMEFVDNSVDEALAGYLPNNFYMVLHNDGSCSLAGRQRAGVPYRHAPLLKNILQLRWRYSFMLVVNLVRHPTSSLVVYGGGCLSGECFFSTSLDLRIFQNGQIV